MRTFIVIVFCLFVWEVVAHAQDALDYTDYAIVLREHVIDGFVDYKKLLRDENRALLNAFLKKSSQIDTSKLAKNDRIALLINLYNAYTLKLILDNYPLDSIRDLSSPWDRKMCLIDGVMYTLDELEKELIVRDYEEARAHAVLNCSAWSCPPLPAVPLTGENLDEMLERAVTDFFMNERLNTFEIKKPFFSSSKKLYIKLSKIFHWYKSDFIDRYGSMKEFLLNYVDNDEYRRYIKEDKFTIDHLKYSWKLNDVGTR